MYINYFFYKIKLFLLYCFYFVCRYFQYLFFEVLCEYFVQYDEYFELEFLVLIFIGLKFDVWFLGLILFEVFIVSIFIYIYDLYMYYIYRFMYMYYLMQLSILDNIDSECYKLDYCYIRINDICICREKSFGVILLCYKYFLRF